MILKPMCYWKIELKPLLLFRLLLVKSKKNIIAVRFSLTQLLSLRKYFMKEEGILDLLFVKKLCFKFK